MLFKVFVEHILVPVLRPNNVVILDNAKVHFDENAMIETTGAGVMYLLLT